MRAEDVEGLTVGSLLDLVAERRPDDDALVYPDRGLRYTYGEFKEVVGEGAPERSWRLGSRGSRRGLGPERPRWVTLQFATGKMGAVLVTVNPAYKAHELKYVLDQSDSAALFLTRGVKDADFVEMLAHAVPELAESTDGELSVQELPHLRHAVLMGGGEHGGLPIMRFEEFMERGEEGLTRGVA